MIERIGLGCKKSKKVDWRSPGFIKKGIAQYVDPWFYWKDANDWCEENCTKRFYLFGEALMLSWTFEIEIDCILFEMNWTCTEREYYLILRDENEHD